MNLVAKEFVACQNDDSPGVLILSPFAGAGGLMHEALMVSYIGTVVVVNVVVGGVFVAKMMTARES
jgi:trehalose-6-phosphate synthase